MRISCDLDGVLADMDSALADLAAAEFGISARSRSQALKARKTPAGTPADGGTDAQTANASKDGTGEPPELAGAAVLSRLTSRQQSRLWQRVRETRNFWESLHEHEPGIVRRFQHLAHQHRWDVLFVTQRPSTAGHTAQIQSQRWLRRHGFDLPAVYTTQASRGPVAAALTIDAHIDDRLENAVDVVSDSRAWSILVWRDDESLDRVLAGAKALRITVVRTVAEALDRLAEA